MKKTILLSLAASCCLFAWSSATILTTEPFDYDTGPLDNSSTSGTGQIGNWQLTPTNTGNATLSVADVTWATPTGYNFTPNSKGVGGVQNATGAFQLSTAIDFDADGELYFSFLYRRPSTAGSIGLISFNSGATEKARAFQTAGGGAVTGSIGDTLSGTGNTFPGTGDMFVVGRIVTSEEGEDTLALQITSSSGTVPATFAATTGTASAETTGSADWVYFWNFANADSPGAYFGEFRIGETYAAVIPEPRTYAALFGLLAIGFVFWRRRARL